MKLLVKQIEVRAEYYHNLRSQLENMYAQSKGNDNTSRCFSMIV